MNILLLSVGTRNKIVQYFKAALGSEGRVIATDMSPLAPALYEADGFYIVPGMSEEGYLDVVLDICEKENIDGVLSLIDPELSLIAKNEALFAQIGTKIVGSSFDNCELSLNKYQMYLWLRNHGYNCAKSYMDMDEFLAAQKAGEIDYPVFVKPALGSASIAISKAEDEETVRFLVAHRDGMMIQEYLQGTEIGVDAYIDMISGKLVSVFAKKKLVMRAGETDKAVSFRNEKLFDLVKRFAEEAGYRGQIDIDIFEIDGEYYISEVNPRFGGGYPHAYECGVNFPRQIIRNLKGETNKWHEPDYPENVYMMKYNEIAIRRERE